MPESISVTLDEAIAYLNELNRLDPRVFPALMRQRVPCNSDFAYHPTVQVGTNHDLPADYTAGLFGIINGLFGIGADGWGHIIAVMSGDGSHIERFERIPHRPESVDA